MANLDIMDYNARKGGDETGGKMRNTAVMRLYTVVLAFAPYSILDACQTICTAFHASQTQYNSWIIVKSRRTTQLTLRRLIYFPA